MTEEKKPGKKENEFKKDCREDAKRLILICQDRTARSFLRQLLTGIPEMEIKAKKYMRDLAYPRSHSKKLIPGLIAGLIAEYPCEVPEESLSFGTSLHQLSQHPDINQKGIERRMEMLLDLEVSSLTQPLHSLVLQARHSKIPIDYGELLYHLYCWDSTEKWVQLRWAGDFWCRKEDTQDEKLKDKNTDKSISVD
jgi:CRISPR type I-E-associated protein CasB/Cse2